MDLCQLATGKEAEETSGEGQRTSKANVAKEHTTNVAKATKGAILRKVTRRTNFMLLLTTG